MAEQDAACAGRRRRRREPLADRYEAALELACAYLAARPRSEAEVRRRLARAEATGATIDRVVGRLRELRYLDDAAFARVRTESLARRGYGPRAIAARLSRAGVASPAGAELPADEASLARETLERRLRGRSFASLDRKEQARYLRWLAGRGFTPGAIRAACAGAGSFDPDPTEV